jgi:hypothetical protein
MPALSKAEAAERLATEVERAKPSELPEIYAELFPETTPAAPPVASEIARHIRGGLEAEEIVDLWNVVFPEDRNVWYDEETRAIHFNEEMAGYVD